MKPSLPVYFTVNLSLIGKDTQSSSGKGAQSSLSSSPQCNGPAEQVEGEGETMAHASGEKRHGRERIRLDAALVQVFPEMGTRGRRRLWDWCLITVNGKARAGGFMVQEGDSIAVMPRVLGERNHAAGAMPGEGRKKEELEKNVSSRVEGRSDRAGGGETKNITKGDGHGDFDCEHWLDSIKLVAMTGEFLVFYKPAGLHTAHLAGGAGRSLEGYISLFMERHGHDLEAVCLHQGGEVQEGNSGHWNCQNNMGRKAIKADNAASSEAGGRADVSYETGVSNLLPRPVLLTRLDCSTSGLVLAARTAAAQKAFREFEALGKVEKTYVAIVKGVPGKGIVKNALDMERRKKTAVLSREGHKTRWTAYETVGSVIMGAPARQVTGRVQEIGQKDPAGYGKTAGQGFFPNLHSSATCPPSIAPISSTTPSLTFSVPTSPQGLNSCEGSRPQFHGRPGTPCAAVLESLLAERTDSPWREFADKEKEPDGSGGRGGATLSLVRVRIHRGARHQIRAHLSSIGHPLAGDVLYGGSWVIETGGPEPGDSAVSSEKFVYPNIEAVEAYGSHAFYLHHGHVRMPGLTAWVLPDSRWDRWRIL